MKAYCMHFHGYTSWDKRERGKALPWKKQTNPQTEKQGRKADPYARPCAGEDPRPLTACVFRPCPVPEGAAVSPAATSSEAELGLGSIRKSISSSALVSGMSEEDTRVTKCIWKIDSCAFPCAQRARGFVCFCLLWGYMEKWGSSLTLCWAIPLWHGSPWLAYRFVGKGRSNWTCFHHGLFMTEVVRCWLNMLRGNSLTAEARGSTLTVIQEARDACICTGQQRKHQSKAFEKSLFF